MAVKRGRAREKDRERAREGERERDKQTNIERGREIDRQPEIDRARTRSRICKHGRTATARLRASRINASLKSLRVNIEYLQDESVAFNASVFHYLHQLVLDGFLQIGTIHLGST